MNFYSFAINLNSSLVLSEIQGTSFKISQLTTGEALILRKSMIASGMQVRFELIGSLEWRVVSEWSGVEDSE